MLVRRARLVACVTHLPWARLSGRGGEGLLFVLVCKEVAHLVIFTSHTQLRLRTCPMGVPSHPKCAYLLLSLVLDALLKVGNRRIHILLFRLSVLLERILQRRLATVLVLFSVSPASVSRLGASVCLQLYRSSLRERSRAAAGLVSSCTARARAHARHTSQYRSQHTHPRKRNNLRLGISPACLALGPRQPRGRRLPASRRAGKRTRQ